MQAIEFHSIVPRIASEWMRPSLTKEQIIAEIRRLADANDGKPVGWRKFFAETGIKESDWLGLHWARWSDAVRAAGLEPNRLNSAIPDTVLLEHLAVFSAELGRLPNRGDMRFREARDPHFSNSKAFARLGTQEARVTRLLDYCRERSAHRSVVPLCEAFLASRTSTPQAEPRDDSAIGVVYLLRFGKYYKIGRSNSAGRRSYEIALQLPEPSTTVHVIRTDDPVGIEAYWHRRFEDKRANGEWFSLDPVDVAAFKRRKFM